MWHHTMVQGLNILFSKIKHWFPISIACSNCPNHRRDLKCFFSTWCATTIASTSIVSKVWPLIFMYVVIIATRTPLWGHTILIIPNNVFYCIVFFLSLNLLHFTLMNWLIWSQISICKDMNNKLIFQNLQFNKDLC